MTYEQRSTTTTLLLTDLLHRVIDTHAASYNDHHGHSYPTTASIDLIAYRWLPTDEEIFSQPSTLTVQFSDFFNLIIPDTTPVIGLTDSELNRLPITIYSHQTSDEICPVCLSEYIVGDQLKSLKCNHYFHSECINPWLKTSTRCPICRSEQIH